MLTKTDSTHSSATSLHRDGKSSTPLESCTTVTPRSAIGDVSTNSACSSVLCSSTPQDFSPYMSPSASNTQLAPSPLQYPQGVGIFSGQQYLKSGSLPQVLYAEGGRP